MNGRHVAPGGRPPTVADLTADDDGLGRALDGIAGCALAGRPVLVALDFDGALAPLQDDPSTSRALPASVTAMAAVSRTPAVRLALVSGRALADLAVLAEVPDGTVLVGSHGAERGRMVAGRLEREDLALPADAVARRAELATALEGAVAGTTARLEHKPAAIVLHTRTASSEDAGRLTAVALALGERDGVDAMHGKDVVELSVLHVTKGDALATLRAQVGSSDQGAAGRPAAGRGAAGPDGAGPAAAGPGEEVALLYAGDDVTDERAFATLALDDVTIKIGPGATAARFRVADPDGLAAALGHLAARLDG